MTQCAVVKLVTPKRYILNGLWFGPEKASRGFIFLHGLASSAFTHHDVLLPLVNSSTMALYFNNRGHDKISGIKHLNKRLKKGYDYGLGGEANEVFTDCDDDIQGAVNFLQGVGVKNIYLVGHSTGCQKAIYYLSRQGKQRYIKGVVLICPMSDYSYWVVSEKPETRKRAIEFAQKLVTAGKPHELLPVDVSPDLLDAQRYLSLNTADSEEEIFCYSQPNKLPLILQKVKIPILVIFAEKDEYGDRSAKQISKWFEKESCSKRLTVKIIKSAVHNLTGQETAAADLIGDWAKSLGISDT
jgi:pimeloyl-ACP methyl ester carboxylesterase